MSRVGPSVRVGTGIFKTKTHYRVTTSFRGKQVEVRYPLHTGLREMRAWQDATRHQMRGQDRVRALTPTESMPPKAVPKHIDRHCYVYFIECGGRIKIGRSTDVRRRVREMSTFTHDPVNLLASVPAHASLEQLIHDRFASARVKGEWYEMTPQLENFIAYMQESLNPLLLLFEYQPL